MKVLLLGGNEHSLELKAWLEEVGEEVIYTEEPVDLEMLKGINLEFIVSYNCRRITPEEVLRKYYPKNLRKYYLPYNKSTQCRYNIIVFLKWIMFYKKRKRL